MTNETHIDRLRNSKIEFLRTEIDAGRAAGEDWAKNEAEYAELRALSQLEPSDMHEADTDEMYAWLDRYLGEQVGMTESLFTHYYGLPGHPSDEFVAAFVTAAVGVWNDAEKHLTINHGEIARASKVAA